MLDAEQVSNQLDSATTIFMGQPVKQYNYLWEYSDAITAMLQDQQITGSVYYQSIKLLYAAATPQELAMDYNMLTS